MPLGLPVPVVGWQGSQWQVWERPHGSTAIVASEQDTNGHYPRWGLSSGSLGRHCILPASLAANRAASIESSGCILPASLAANRAAYLAYQCPESSRAETWTNIVYIASVQGPCKHHRQSGSLRPASRIQAEPGQGAEMKPTRQITQDGSRSASVCCRGEAPAVRLLQTGGEAPAVHLAIIP